MVDETLHLGLPLPSPDAPSQRAEVARVRSALEGLDAHAQATDGRLDGAEAVLALLEGRVGNLEAVPPGVTLVRTPTITSPFADATGVSRTPTITADAYGSVYGRAHAATRIQLAADDAFTVILRDSGVLGAVTSWAVTGGALAESAVHYARACYRDEDGVWSEWSPVVSFTTVETAIAAPVITSPAAGATGIAKTPTFTCSAFGLTSGADTHAASRWQVSTDPNFATTVIDTGDDAANKTSLTVLSALAGGTTHYLRVRHKGNLGEYSAWSATVAFTTWNFAQWLLRVGRPTTVTTNAVETFARALVDGAGSIYAVGTDRSHESGGAVYPAGYVLKVNSDGTTLWERRYAHAYPAEFHAAVLDAAGNLYCIGPAYDGYVNDVTVAKFDSSGGLVAHKCYQGTAVNAVHDAVYDGSGNIYIACRDTASRSLLIKIDTSLALQWASQCSAGGMILRGVACNPASSTVYVCGSKDAGAYVARLDTSGAFLGHSLSPTLSGWTIQFNKCAWANGYLRCVGTMTDGTTVRAVSWEFDATLNTSAYKYSTTLANAEAVCRETGGAYWSAGTKLVAGNKAAFVMRNNAADVDRALRDADDDVEIYGVALDPSGNVIFAGRHQTEAAVATMLLGTMAGTGGSTGTVANLAELSWTDDGSAFDADFSGHGWGVDTTNTFSSFTSLSAATPYQSSQAVTRAKTLAPY